MKTVLDTLRMVGGLFRRGASALLVLPIRFYQRFISPLTRAHCRYKPTCSQYAIEALRKHGPLKGLWLAVYRIFRCNPFGGFGYDPVPDRFRFFYYKRSMWGAAPLLIDIHTHHEPAIAGTAIVSNGIHPWAIDDAWKRTFETYTKTAKNVLFIGESGLDKRRGPSLELQQEVFMEHVRLSEALGKPMVVHCVKALPEMLEIRKAFRCSQTWVFHGFRGGIEQAEQIWRAGCHVSFGLSFREETLRATPAAELFIESDEADINEAYRRVSDCLGQPEEALRQQVNDNILRLLAG